MRIQLTKSIGFGGSPAERAAYSSGQSTVPKTRRRAGGRSRRRAARSHAQAASARAVGPAALSERRTRLTAEFTELQWDLGGIVYEMASRDHFRLDLIVRHAAKLQAVDAELAEIERMLRLEQAGAGGTCPGCGALHARGAVYCWQCGKNLIAQEPVAAALAPTTVTSQPQPSAASPPVPPVPPQPANPNNHGS